MSRIRLIREALDDLIRLFRGPLPPPPVVAPDVLPRPPVTVPAPAPAPDPDPDPRPRPLPVPGPLPDRACTTCPRCPPRDDGGPTRHAYGNVDAAALRGYRYQHFVCPWHPHDPAARWIEEWAWRGVNFDGLHPAECHLYEAKHGYDGFLEQEDWSADGRPKLKPWAREVFATAIVQAARQANAVRPHWPEVKLTWVFGSMTTKLYLYQQFLGRGLVPPIDAEVRPFNE